MGPATTTYVSYLGLINRVTNVYASVTVDANTPGLNFHSCHEDATSVLRIAMAAGTMAPRSMILELARLRSLLIRLP